nr:MAG TPA: hypothetical protein [Caudoviricetes sp.]
MQFIANIICHFKYLVLDHYYSVCSIRHIFFFISRLLGVFHHE